MVLDSLSLEQLEKIPWNRKYISGAQIPAEPPLKQIKNMIGVPFLKRDPRYALFYSWVEIVKGVGATRSKVLDACCGRGQISSILSLKGHDVSACDIDDCFGANGSTNFRRVDLNDTLPFPNNYFDVVINCEGLEYLNYSEKFVSEAARVLKKRARLIISIPNINSIAGRLGFLRTGKLLSYDSNIIGRKNVIYLPYLFQLLKQHDFSVSDTRGNVPLSSSKVRLFEKMMRILMNDQGAASVLSYAHSLIIFCTISK